MTKKKLYFIAGLPRAGSTLLCNLLLQNNKVFVSTTSSMIDLILQIRDAWESFDGHKGNPIGQDKWNVINAIIENYHNTDSHIIFDKNRGTTAHIEFLEKALGYEIKIICCVRNLEDILSSFEKLYRKERANQEIHSEFKVPRMKTLEGRCDLWLSEDGVLGRPYLSMKDAFDRGLTSRMKILPYEFFTHNPEQTMKEIYEWLELESFEHNFSNIKQVVYENDLGYGWGENLHKITEGNIIPATSDANLILGDKITALYSNKEFWKVF